ncbi:type II toxin-antitoxin system RelE/ParE family toxin [Thiovibrio sp. JS02]
MRIKWSRLALLDLDAIGAFVAADSPAAAVDIVVQVIRSVSLLADQPGIGRAGRVPGTRELLVPGLPYIVPYRVKDGVVEVLRVYHASRKWPERW